jgi:hypothetical protein
MPNSRRIPLVSSQNTKPQPGDMVVLTKIPAGLLDGLPQEDQDAISAILGKPVLLNEYDDAGIAELEFTDKSGVVHYIYVDLAAIQLAE